MKAKKSNKNPAPFSLLPFPSLLFFLFSLFSFLSCQTSPTIFDSVLEETHLPLDTGASIYLIADAKQARPIIDLLPIPELRDRQTLQMLDMTDFLAAAMFPQESGRRFQLAAWGTYPSSRAGMALNANRHWEKQTNSTGQTFWYAPAAGLSIALNSRQAFAVSSISSNRQPIEPEAVKPGAEIPEGFAEFARGAPLSCWLDNPGPVIIRMLNSINVPIRFPVQQLFINIYTLPANQTEAIIRMQFENATQARGAATILNLASAFVPNDFEFASILFANAPVQNGNNVDIKTARLSETDLKTLLGMLMSL